MKAFKGMNKQGFLLNQFEFIYYFVFLGQIQNQLDINSTDFYLTIMNENISWFKISMHEIIFVQICITLKYLLK